MNRETAHRAPAGASRRAPGSPGDRVARTRAEDRRGGAATRDRPDRPTTRDLLVTSLAPPRPAQVAHDGDRPEVAAGRDPDPARPGTTRDRLATALTPSRRKTRPTGEVARRPPTPGPGRASSRPSPVHPGAARRTGPTPHHEPFRPGGTTDEHRARGPPVVMTKLASTVLDDPWELQAEAVAAQVLRGSLVPGASAWRPHSAPSAGHGHLPTEVESVCATKGAGESLPATVRARVEPYLGVDLSGVRVRRDPAAAHAAHALRARAFTVGSTIYLAASSSPADLGLMAHEATHVAQQARAPPLRRTVMPALSDWIGSAADWVPDWVLDGMMAILRAIPGYTAISYVLGRDPITGDPVTVDVQALLETVLTRGPFGPAVGAVLQTLDVLSGVVEAVRAELAAYNLTTSRILSDVRAAWQEMGLTLGIAGNAAIVRRYLLAFIADIGRLVSALVARVLEMVRAAVVALVEPLLQTPEIAPVWNLTKKVIRWDPLRGQPVNAPTVEILGDFLTLIGENERLAQMRERGTLQETADWLDTQFEIFVGLVVDLGTLFSDAWAAISPENLPQLPTTLPELAGRAFSLVGRVGAFVTTIIAKILELVKNALLGMLSEHAHRIPGFHLLTVVLRRNPFTGEAVPRTAENLIKGFVTLLPGGQAMYDELSQSGVIGDAAGRIESAMAELGISWAMVTELFLGIWNSLSLDDLLEPVTAFRRIIDQFGEPLGRLIRFVTVVIRVVVELILRLMNFPVDLLGNVITNAMQAIDDIKRDPVGFLRNLMAAMKQGFLGFFDRFGQYLLDGLVAWLFRGLGPLGIERPPDLSLQSVLTLVLQVLGLTVDHLWEKLGEHIGQERVQQIRGALDTLTGIWTFITDVQREGVAAIWRHVSDQLSNLWQTILDAATQWIMRTVVARATTRLLSMLDPTGIMAVINSAVAIFNAIQSVIEYINDILQVVDRYVSTIAAVAAGNVTPGAQMLERGLASIIPIAIGFLAAQVGLRDLPEEIARIIRGVRVQVDRAIDWLIAQALRLGQAVLNALGIGGEESTDSQEETPGSTAVKNRAGDRLAEIITGDSDMAAIQRAVDQVFRELRPEGLRSLTLVTDEATGGFDIMASASAAQSVADVIPRVAAGQASGATEIAMRLTLSTQPQQDVVGVGGISVLAGGSDLGQREYRQRGVSHARIHAARGEPGSGLAREAAGGARWEGALFEMVDDVQPARFWSIGGTHESDSGESHAEGGLDRYLRGLSVDTLRTVKKIEVELRPYGPCGCCAPILVDLIGFLKGYRRRIHAQLVWTQGYHGYFGNPSTRCGPTDEANVAGLGSAGWLRLGPAYERPSGGGASGSWSLQQAGGRRRG